MGDKFRAKQCGVESFGDLILLLLRACSFTDVVLRKALIKLLIL